MSAIFLMEPLPDHVANGGVVARRNTGSQTADQAFRGESATPPLSRFFKVLLDELQYILAAVASEFAGPFFDGRKNSRLDAHGKEFCHTISMTLIASLSPPIMAKINFMGKSSVCVLPYD